MTRLCYVCITPTLSLTIYPLTLSRFTSGGRVIGVPEVAGEGRRGWKGPERGGRRLHLGKPIKWVKIGWILMSIRPQGSLFEHSFLETVSEAQDPKN